MAEADPEISQFAQTCRRPDINQGHVLRSRYLDGFALMESGVSRKALALSATVKPNAPLSQKLNLIANEAQLQPSRFFHPEHVLALVKQIRAASEVRSNLVHARMLSTIADDGRQFWMFQNIGKQPDETNPFQLVLDAATFERQITSLATLVKKLARQKLKATIPAAPAPASG